MLGGSTLCSGVGMQVNPVVHPGNDPGMDLACTGDTPGRFTLERTRNALEMHPGDAPTRHPASLFILI